MPFFPIVIPTYNRPAQLAVCLQACARLDYPRDRVAARSLRTESVRIPESIRENHSEPVMRV